MTTILTQTVARLLFVPTLMVALAILVKGYGDTGDGFAAGVIAALAVLTQSVAFGHRRVERALPVVRFAPAVGFAGLALALAVTFAPVLRGEPILTHAPAAGAEVVHLGTVELITPVLFDVGVFLLVFGFALSTIGAFAARGERRGP